DEARQFVAVEIEDIHEAMPRASHVVFLIFVLKREGDIQLAIDVADSEGCITHRKICVSEILHPAEARVVHFNPATKKICGVDEGAVIGGPDGEAFVHGASLVVVCTENGMGSVNSWTPPTDRAVFRGEDKQ